MRHWRRVPRILQQHVYATWRDFRVHQRDPLNYAAKLKTYREAAAEAVRVVSPNARVFAPRAVL